MGPRVKLTWASFWWSRGCSVLHWHACSIPGPGKNWSFKMRETREHKYQKNPFAMSLACCAPVCSKYSSQSENTVSAGTPPYHPAVSLAAGNRPNTCQTRSGASVLHETSECPCQATWSISQMLLWYQLVASTELCARLLELPLRNTVLLNCSKESTLISFLFCEFLWLIPTTQAAT